MGLNRPTSSTAGYSPADRRYRSDWMGAIERESLLLSEGWRVEWSRNARRWVALLKDRDADIEHGAVVGEGKTKADAIRKADIACHQGLRVRRMADGYPRSGRYVELVDATARILHVAEQLRLGLDPLRNGLSEVLIAARFDHTLRTRVHGADGTDANGNRFEYKIITASKPRNRGPRYVFHYANDVPEKFGGAIIACRTDFAISLEQVWYWPPDRVIKRQSIYLKELPGLGAEDARTWNAEQLRQRVAEALAARAAVHGAGRRGAHSSSAPREHRGKTVAGSTTDRKF